MARSGGGLLWRVDDVDTVAESDTPDDFGQLAFALQAASGFRGRCNELEHHQSSSVLRQRAPAAQRSMSHRGEHALDRVRGAQMSSPGSEYRLPARRRWSRTRARASHKLPHPSTTVEDIADHQPGSVITLESPPVAAASPFDRKPSEPNRPDQATQDGDRSALERILQSGQLAVLAGFPWRPLRSGA